MKKILLVEDDPGVARAFVRVLKLSFEDIEVIHTTTMVSALRTLREQNDIVAVITDWQFPFRDDDGRGPRDAAGKLVYDEAHRMGLPVAVMSGREGGAVDDIKPWFTKPVTNKELTGWVRSVLPA